MNLTQYGFRFSLLPLFTILLTSHFLSISVMSSSSSSSLSSCPVEDSGPVVPNTPLVAFLERVQEAALETYGSENFDPKLYVDMSIRQNLSVVARAFDQLPRGGNGSVSATELNAFVQEYLLGPETALEYVVPVDFVDRPEGFLPKVESPAMRNWALEVHGIWRNLSRKVSARVGERPEDFTLLPLKNPVVIPGSRFREVYYWDSYWVIRGLLASKMYETAKGIVYNLISLIDEYGHVLNGARAYYTNRSQPPLLSSMVIDIYRRTGDKKLIEKALPALLKEHTFWTSGVHKVVIEDAKGSKHSLSRYYAKWNQPRPESGTTDIETASRLPNNCSKALLYREIASTAESGWDFSARWMRNGSDLTTLATTSIIPVDLNAFILKMELDITSMAHDLGDNVTAARFKEVSHGRKHSINSILWNSEKHQWFDYWLSDSDNSKVHKWTASGQNKKSFASNFVPLWLEPYNSDAKMAEKVLKSLKSSGLINTVGIATTLTNSGEQWDFPNGWAPLQHMIVEGLLRSGLEPAKVLAEEIAVNWIKTNYVAYNQTGNMHEKYTVDKCGDFGGGGEYVPQTGFGWSNGLVLTFLEEFGWPKGLSLDCPKVKPGAV